MYFDRSTGLAIGGLVALAAAMGIGRFVYTPILPAMLEGLAWSKADAGLVASANFLGYRAGALAAAHPAVSRRPRAWLLAGLFASAATTATMALPSALPWFIALRLVGGLASAFVIVCASSLVLARLAASGRAGLSAIHFAGVGTGILVSAIAVLAMLAAGIDWRGLWAGTGAIAAVGLVLVALLVPASDGVALTAPPSQGPVAKRGLGAVTLAYGLFGFGYVITATFIVTMVRLTPEIRSLEPWIWILFGAAAVPSVAAWVRLGGRFGLTRAFAVAAVIEAVGVALSVEWVGPAGIAASAILLGGTFMGLTALGLMIGRSLSAGDPQKAIGRMTAAFGLGQMIGPLVGGQLFEMTGSFRAASLIAATALVMAAGLALSVERAGKG